MCVAKLSFAASTFLSISRDKALALGTATLSGVSASAVMASDIPTAFLTAVSCPRLCARCPVLPNQDDAAAVDDFGRRQVRQGEGDVLMWLRCVLSREL
mmetsp:Transcript_5090/g.15477  ORF Transcript_5090/g.15477 Transcript_5090/m.15477 type:complete len:99 (+) Transcript_5090:829-1125(+)